MENHSLADVVNLFLQNKYYDSITAIEDLQKQKLEPVMEAVIESWKLLIKAEINYEESFEYEKSLDFYNQAIEILKKHFSVTKENQTKLVLQMLEQNIEGEKGTAVGDMNIDLGNFSVTAKSYQEASLNFQKARKSLVNIKKESLKEFGIDGGNFPKYLDGIALYCNGLSLFAQGMHLDLTEDFPKAVELYKNAVKKLEEANSVLKILETPVLSSESLSFKNACADRIKFLDSLKRRKWLKINNLIVKFKNFFFISGVSNENFDEIVKKFYKFGYADYSEPSPLVSPRYAEDFSYYKIKLEDIVLETLIIDKIKNMKFSVELSIFKTGVCVVTYSSEVTESLTPEEVKRLRMLHTDYVPNFNMSVGKEKLTNIDFLNYSKRIQKEAKKAISSFPNLDVIEPSLNFTMLDIRSINQDHIPVKELVEKFPEMNSLFVPVVQTPLGVE